MRIHRFKSGRRNSTRKAECGPEGKKKKEKRGLWHVQELTRQFQQHTRSILASLNSGAANREALVMEQNSALQAGDNM
jgi:hypothetical protein